MAAEFLTPYYSMSTDGVRKYGTGVLPRFDAVFGHNPETDILHLDFGCVLRLSGCKGVSDMAPRAWTAY
jgi:hypothetical protein